MNILNNAQFQHFSVIEIAIENDIDINYQSTTEPSESR